MTQPFLTDDDYWLCVCAARLADLDPQGADHENEARGLLRDAPYRRLDPIMAADFFVRARAAPVE